MVDVREAAARTLAAGSARVSVDIFFDPPPTRRFITLAEHRTEGLADLTRRRVELDVVVSASWDALTRRLEEKYPWLDDEDDDEHEPGGMSRLIGACRYVSYGGRWTAGPEPCDPEGLRPEDNPTWILDALAGAGAARAIATEDVRGVRTERFAMAPVDVRAAFDATGGGIEVQRIGNFERPTLRGDVWVDGDGLVRRVTYMRPPVVRPRARPSKTIPALWRTVEFWDFGVPVSIEVPELSPPSEAVSLAETVRRAWQFGRWAYRKRADYRRRTAPPS